MFFSRKDLIAFNASVDVSVSCGDQVAIKRASRGNRPSYVGMLFEPTGEDCKTVGHRRRIARLGIEGLALDGLINQVGPAAQTIRLTDPMSSESLLSCSHLVVYTSRRTTRMFQTMGV